MMHYVAIKSKNLEKQIERLEREIAQQEKKVKEYDSLIAQTATEYEKLNTYLEEKAQEEAVLDGLYEQWEQLSSQLEDGE